MVDVTIFVPTTGSTTIPVSSLAKSGFVPGTGMIATLHRIDWAPGIVRSCLVISLLRGGRGSRDRRAVQFPLRPLGGAGAALCLEQEPRLQTRDPRDAAESPRLGSGPTKTFSLLSGNFSPGGFVSHRAGSNAMGLASDGLKRGLALGGEGASC